MYSVWDDKIHCSDFSLIQSHKYVFYNLCCFIKMCIRRTRYMHRVFKRGFNFGLFSILFSFFFFQNNKKRHRNTQRCWSATHSAPPVINAERHSDLTAPQRGGEELKWGNPSKSGFCAPVLFMSAAEVNETMRAWNSLMEPVCFQPWLFLKEAKDKRLKERGSPL